MTARTRTAARCTECERALAAWQFASGKVVPIGSVSGCPCGATSFRVLANGNSEA
ncbi:hypothetical protein ACFQO4_11725 [Saliphagus sp. GCM10025334]